MNKLILANWKSNKTEKEAVDWISTYSSNNSHTVVACVPFTLLHAVRNTINQEHKDVLLGLQNISAFPAGAYTGEVCTRNISNMDVKYIIVGHSERRKYLHETNQDVANKVTQILSESITPIVCVDKDNVFAQANALQEQEREKCIVAFEPIDHIGTGIIDPIEDVLLVCEDIRKAFSSKTKVLYGGSVDEKNAQPYLHNEHIDGLLVGGASLDVKKFTSMLSI